jgi:hypothetical protein
MKYVFVDDGYPEANDYASNYELVMTGRRAVCANSGIRIPAAARPAWWVRWRASWVAWCGGHGFRRPCLVAGGL